MHTSRQKAAHTCGDLPTTAAPATNPSSRKYHDQSWLIMASLDACEGNHHSPLMSRSRSRIPGLLYLIVLLTAGVALNFVQAQEAKRLLLIGQGPDGHPPATHEFMPGVRVMEKLLGAHKNIRITVTKADEPWPEGPALIDQADGIVMFVTQGARWTKNDPQRHAARKRLAQRKYKVLETDVTVLDHDHPIATGINNFRINDEFYYRLDFVKPPLRVHPLLAARIEDGDETACWSWDRPDGGRSFGFVAIHFHANWQREEYRRLVVQGILWTLGKPIPKAGVNVDIDLKVLELK